MTPATKTKILISLLIVTSLFGHLEWGQGKQMFLFQVEAEIFTKILKDPLSVLHPFTVLPFIGQLILLFTLFQKQPVKVLTYIGMGCIGILLALVLFIGIIEMKFSILFSAVPFFVVAFFTIWHFRKMKVAGAN